MNPEDENLTTNPATPAGPGPQAATHPRAKGAYPPGVWLALSAAARKKRAPQASRSARRPSKIGFLCPTARPSCTCFRVAAASSPVFSTILQRGRGESRREKRAAAEKAPELQTVDFFCRM